MININVDIDYVLKFCREINVFDVESNKLLAAFFKYEDGWLFVKDHRTNFITDKEVVSALEEYIHGDKQIAIIIPNIILTAFAGGKKDAQN